MLFLFCFCLVAYCQCNARVYHNPMPSKCVYSGKFMQKAALKLNMTLKIARADKQAVRLTYNWSSEFYSTLIVLNITGDFWQF